MVIMNLAKTKSICEYRVFDPIGFSPLRCGAVLSSGGFEAVFSLIRRSIILVLGGRLVSLARDILDQHIRNSVELAKMKQERATKLGVHLLQPRIACFLSLSFSVFFGFLVWGAVILVSSFSP